ncbi:response regulator [Bradyrhizobium japonicum]|uniref:response regulator n=1 Tax=Bradyrhizobium japonicum TaxID=375 RepID=UPI0032DFA403
MNEPLKILIAEDDFQVQEMLEDALSEGGFLAEILSSAEDAVALFNSEIASFRALVTDVNLGGRMSGWDLARIARERDPTFPVVYDRDGRRGLGQVWRAQQHPSHEAVRTGSAGDRGIPASERQRTPGLAGSDELERSRPHAIPRLARRS